MKKPVNKKIIDKVKWRNASRSAIFGELAEKYKVNMQSKSTYSKYYVLFE